MYGLNLDLTYGNLEYEHPYSGTGKFEANCFCIM